MLNVLLLLAIGYFVYKNFGSTPLPKDEQLAERKKQARAQKRAAKKAAKTVDVKPHVIHADRAPNKKTDTPLPTEGVAALQAADPAFNEQDFLEGAKSAYKSYWEAVNKKDEDSLADITSPEIFEETLDEMEDLEKQNLRKRVEVVDIKEATLLTAYLHGKTAVAEVLYTVDQKTWHEASDSPEQTEELAEEVKTVWTWARPLLSDSPEWEVQAIKPYVVN